MKTEIREKNGVTYLKFHPNGQDQPIELPVITKGARKDTNAWSWNGDRDKPTLKPSIKMTSYHPTVAVSHFWLNDGECKHLGDSTDGLAGKTLPLKDLPEIKILTDEDIDNLSNAVGAINEIINKW